MSGRDGPRLWGSGRWSVGDQKNRLQPAHGCSIGLFGEGKSEIPDKGLPAEITTHNFGSVDSIGVVLFCGGRRRLSVPQARFLLHGVSANFEAAAALEEKQLDERLKGLRIDIENIAKVVAANTGKSTQEVVSAMHDRTTLNPEEAKAWGLLDEIKSELFPEGAEVIQIQFQQQQRP